MKNNFDIENVINEIDDYAIISLDVDGTIINWNRGAEKLKGYAADEIIGENFSIFYPEEEIENGLPQKLLHRAQTKGKAKDEGWRMRKDGSRFWGSVLIVKITDHADNHTGFLKITRDLTKRHTLEKSLKNLNQQLEKKVEKRSKELLQTEKKFRHALASMHEGVLIVDTTLHLIYVNEAFLGFFNVEQSNLQNKLITGIFTNSQGRFFCNRIEECVASGQHDTFSLQLNYNGIDKVLQIGLNPVQEGVFITCADQTEKAQLSAELDKNLNYLSDYKSALDESAIVAITDHRGIITHVNDNFCRISQYSANELIGNDHSMVNSGYHSKEFMKDLWRKILSGERWNGEIKNLAKDGSYYWVDTSIVPFLDAENKPYQFLAIRFDITKRKNAEQKLLKTNRLLRFISSVNRTIVKVTDLQALADESSRIAVEIGGYAAAALGLLNSSNEIEIVSGFGHNSILEKIGEVSGKNLDSPDIANYPSVIVLKSGQKHFYSNLDNLPETESWQSGFLNADIKAVISLPLFRMGQVIGFFSLYCDGTKEFDKDEMDILDEACGDISFALDVLEKERLHKATEALVVSNEKLFRSLIENSSDMKTLTNEEGIFIYGSPSVSKTFGYSLNEFLHKSVFEFVHPADLPDLLKNRAILLTNNGGSFNFQYRFLHRKGHYIWCEGTLTNMLHEPAVAAFVSNFYDISERKKAEEVKAFNQRNLNALINNTSDVIWSINKKYELISFNQPFVNQVLLFAGTEPKQGEKVFSFIAVGNQGSRFKSYYERAFQGEIFTEVEYSSDPEESWAEISFYPLRIDGKIEGTACYLRNITDKKKAEQERDRMIDEIIQRNKNFEQFAYIVSHNLRAPVANILGISRLLEYELSAEDRKATQEALFKAVAHLDSVVIDLNKILQFGTRQTKQREKIRFSEITHTILESIENLVLEEKVQVQLDFEEIDEIESVRSYIHSVFFCLITNAIKYRREEVDTLLKITSEKTMKNVIIKFWDNGRGIDLTKYGEAIFGLYKRFHMHVEGKGLGLFMTKMQLEELGGNISVESEPNKYCIFTVTLPLKKTE
ncbi:PAS domain S-box protein [bacterium]|nr:PAS domain S-box protein [bacterium]